MPRIDTPAPALPEDVTAAKRVMRVELRARRAALPAALRNASALLIASHVERLVAGLPLGPVALFASLPEEIDTQPIAAALAAAGRPLLLPRQVRRGTALALHAWRPGDALVAGPFGVPEPPAEAPLGRPVIMLVPLLAFDAAGGRLGYGAGFYDRTIAAHGEPPPGPVTVGLAFAAQEVVRVPMAAHDEPLDYVVTEIGTRAGRRGRSADPAPLPPAGG